MRKFDLSLRSSRSSYFATFRHQLTILSKTDALDEEFFFYLYGDHRDLHSFPTRRSSDLQSDFEPGTALRSRHALSRKVRAHSKRLRRSEEHTSELQSRGHLVCRLLLEKKKKQVNNIINKKKKKKKKKQKKKKQKK